MGARRSGKVDTGPALICIIDVREVYQVPCQTEKRRYFSAMVLLIVEKPSSMRQGLPG
jgi:hypothetical protein